MKRVLIIQPTLPSYRVDLFERLAQMLKAQGGELWVHYAEQDYLGVCAAKQIPINLEVSKKYYWTKGLFQKTPLSYPFVPLKALLWAQVVIIPGHLHELEVGLSALLSKIRGIKIIWWGSFPKENAWKRKVRIWVAGHCDGIATYMPSQKAKLPPSLQAKSLSLNNGLKPLDDSLDAPKLSKRPRGIAIIGRPSPKSKILTCLTELTQWQGESIQVHLIGTSKEELQNQLIESPYVTIHAYGYVENEQDLLKILSQCRVSFYPGAIGLSLMEAVRAGLPTLLASPPAEHMPEFELFEEGKLGRYFSSDEDPVLKDYPRWPQALRAMLNDEQWLDQAQAHCLAQGELYSTKVMAENLYELICRSS